MNSFKANKLHIGIFGKRNSGKSTLMNVLLGQDFSIVSDVLGTTTDVNQKSMELLPIGPVVLMDTAGFDDTDNLGIKRVEKTYKALDRVDIGIFVFDYKPLDEVEIEFLKTLKERNIKTLGIINKEDEGKIQEKDLNIIKEYVKQTITLSLKEDEKAREKIKQGLIDILPNEIITSTNALSGLVEKGDNIILVIPIDKEAPKDRIILPQVQIIRNVLDEDCTTLICKENNLEEALKSLVKKPKMVITDSQAFKKVSEIVPEDILLTSFSILFARLKGDFETFYNGTKKLDNLKDNDKILICESCTHHPIEDDIGRVKIPNLIKKYTNKNLEFEFYSGYDFPKDIEKYSLIVHCGACMTNKREMLTRIMKAKNHNVPITNYGMVISKCLNILERATKCFN